MKYPSHCDPQVGEVPARFFLRAFGFTTVLFLLELLFLRPYFLVNDDFFLLSITKGIGITLAPDPHVFFSHIFFSMPLSWLYQLFPDIPWYPIALLSVQFLAFTSLALSLTMNTRKQSHALLLYGVFFTCFGLYSFQNLNLTLTSGLAALCGFFLLLRLIDGSHVPMRRCILALGTLCVFLSFILRPETFPIFVAAATPFLLMALGGNQTRRKALIFFATAFVLWGGLSFLQRAYYSQTPDWDQYRSTYPINRAVHDFYPIRYEADTQLLFDRIGWSKNDFFLFLGWYYWDADRYSVENLKAIKSYFSSYKPLTSVLIQIRALLLDRIFLSLACCLLLALLCLQRPYPHGFIWCILWNLGLVLCLVVWFKVPERIILPLVSFVVIGAFQACLARKDDPVPLVEKMRGQTIAILLACLLIPSFLYSAHRVGQTKRLKERELKDAVTALQPRRDQLFIVWDSIFPFENIGAFDDLAPYQTFHMLSFAAYQQSPIGDRMLTHFSVKNPLRDAVDRPDIFLICNPYEGAMALTYLREKFNLQVQPRLAFDSSSFQVYQFFSSRH